MNNDDPLGWEKLMDYIRAENEKIEKEEKEEEEIWWEYPLTSSIKCQDRLYGEWTEDDNG